MIFDLGSKSRHRTLPDRAMEQMVWYEFIGLASLKELEAFITSRREPATGHRQPRPTQDADSPAQQPPCRKDLAGHPKRTSATRQEQSRLRIMREPPKVFRGLAAITGPGDCGPANSS